MVPKRGAIPQVLRYFIRLRRPGPCQSREDWTRRNAREIAHFARKVSARYNETSLLRVAASANPQAREAAVFALGLTGSWNCNGELAGMLQDEEGSVRRAVAEALWRVWFRGRLPEDAALLREALDLETRGMVLEALNQLVRRRPDFAEAWNQRAIIHFQGRDFAASARDCERVLALNPHHFGAQAGLAQSLMRLGRSTVALWAFRKAEGLNPHMAGVSSTIRLLEKALGDDSAAA